MRKEILFGYNFFQIQIQIQCKKKNHYFQILQRKIEDEE
jgi:hypothetical protein